MKEKNPLNEKYVCKLSTGSVVQLHTSRWLETVERHRRLIRKPNNPLSTRPLRIYHLLFETRSRQRSLAVFGCQSKCGDLGGQRADSLPCSFTWTCTLGRQCSLTSWPGAILLLVFYNNNRSNSAAKIPTS